MKEGNLAPPTRHALLWQTEEFYDEEKCLNELERVFDLCHGCRRCVSLCNSFPTLFDLVDESSTFEVDGVDKKDYWKVVDECYMCDLCYMTKCPYTPPHEWNIDFPHIMLRAKAIKYKKGDTKLRDKVITSTDNIGKLASIPVVVNVVNAANNNSSIRKGMEKAIGISADAHLPAYSSKKLRNTKIQPFEVEPVPAGETTGKVAIFATCYGNYNEPDLGRDLIAVLQHNGIEVALVDKEQCCGMPKYELGNLAAVAKAKEANIPELDKWVQDGWDIMAPVPSCALMFRQELPLMYPDDAQVQNVKNAIYDPFEYLMLRHKAGVLKTDFSHPLGNVLLHSACHQRVQNIGPKTKEVLELVQETTVKTADRCSGHDGTYAVKEESRAASVKICRPVANKVKTGEVDIYGSDCAIAGHHIEDVLGDSSIPMAHPISMLRKAYAI